MGTAPKMPGGRNVYGTLALFFQWYDYTCRGDYASSIFSSGMVSNYKYRLVAAKNCTLQWHFVQNNANGFWLTVAVVGSGESSSPTVVENGTVTLKKGDTLVIGYNHGSSSGASQFLITARLVKG